MTMSWVPHASLKGPAGLVRLSAGQLDAGEGKCAEFAALKARPRVWPKQFEERRDAPWEGFPLGLVMAALDGVEFGGLDAEVSVQKVLEETPKSVHPGVEGWVRQAVGTYLEDARWLADELGDVVLLPHRESRVLQHVASPLEARVLTGWGRWYASADGAVREVRRLRVSRVGAGDDPSNLALAQLAAFGAKAAGSVYRDMPVEVRADAGPAKRVRVVEVVVSDERVPKVVVDAGPEEIARRYRERAQPVASDVVFGGRRQPGSDCAQCKLRAECDALPHVPGLLGLDGSGTHRRVWSAATAGQYRICPAQAHLRDQRLPGDWSDHPAIRRGTLVHTWLEVAHSRLPYRACAEEDLPEALAGFAAELMTPDEYRQIRPFLLSHLEVCPLRTDANVTSLTAEPATAAYDAQADVLVVAHPDLVYVAGGRTFYREQKTTGGSAAWDADTLFERVPQLALAVCLIADGAFGGEAPVSGTVELEVMSPAGASLFSFDTGDAGVVARARAELVRLAGGWHTDVEFRPRPGRHCATCPVARWCPDRHAPDTGPIEVDGVLIDPRTGEILNEAPVTGLAQAVASTVAEPDPDDEPPF
ncbi:PD-(D/E)XK nuclease family protein [Actinocorallia libanotica]|uniref:PD-(D/E)XK endonuclease-like domain-containing protein n=1 Tax=Actinocorallia libanotica TaxID=46162 RepID=A0ABN1R480_9ACTN